MEKEAAAMAFICIRFFNFRYVSRICFHDLHTCWNRVLLIEWRWPEKWGEEDIVKQ